MLYSLALLRSKALILVMTWMSLGNTVLSEVHRAWRPPDLSDFMSMKRP